MRLFPIVILIVFAASIILLIATLYMTYMPGRSRESRATELSAEETAMRDRLREHVVQLAGTIGPRTVHNEGSLERSVNYLRDQFGSLGYTSSVEGVPDRTSPPIAFNIWVEVRGTASPDEIIVIGAHYDTASPHCPGANDNGTGVALLVELARSFHARPVSRTLRFVAFANEEMPYFQSDRMGSLVHARRAKERNEAITAMVSLETLGYFSEAPQSQSYPIPVLNYLYPGQGNFIAFVGNLSSAPLVRRVVASFRNVAAIPSEGAALPVWLPGVAWSDQWSFWEQGYRAVMVTDTAPFRYPYYHTEHDTPEKLNYDALAQIGTGLIEVISALANAP